MPDRLGLATVPLVGVKKPEVVCHAVYAGAMVTCDCGASAPVLVPGLDRAGLCLACKTKYVIARLIHRNEEGLVSLDVQVAKWSGPMSASRELDR